MKKTSSDVPPKAALREKERRRREIRAEQQQRAHLEFNASLAPHLHQRIRPVETSQGTTVWVGEGAVKTLNDFLAQGLSLGGARAFADFDRTMRLAAEEVGPAVIYQSKAELESAAAAIKREIQDAAEREDFAPFLDAAAHYRFALFRDDDFLALAERIDRAAIAGDKNATGTLNLLLKNLRVGRGKTGSPTTDPEEKRQNWRATTQRRRSDISDHTQKLSALLEKSDRGALNKLLVAWEKGRDTRKKAAAKAWKEKEKRGDR